MADINTDGTTIAARNAFRVHEKRGLEIRKTMFIFAAQGLKTLCICHGAALITALAFSVFLVQQGRQVPKDIQASYLYFGVGFCLSLLAFLFACMSQYAYMQANKSGVFSYQYPFIHGTPDSNRNEAAGRLAQSWAVWSSFLSIGLMGFGLYSTFRIF